MNLILTAIEAAAVTAAVVWAIVAIWSHFVLTIYPPVPSIFVFYIFYHHITYQFLNLLKIKSDINQQDLKCVDLYFVKSE